MIGKLSGRLDESGEGRVIVDVGGVGYLVFASNRTLAQLGARGEAVSLLIETHVRADHIHLYGFADAGEQAWFRLLQGVQGVGSRLALAILSTLSPAELTQAMAANDRTALTRAPGVGTKLAARLISELKDKAAGLQLGTVAQQGDAIVPAPEDNLAGNTAVKDAARALEGLGYRPSEALSAVAKARKSAGEAAGVEDLIKGALRELAW
ncbi:MAG: Holliday junction branch migration protein RuvA [Rhodospirillales bacterium]|nr:Holliday junction branch migration protein RuvA [Rhodospirillales bacterium]